MPERIDYNSRIQNLMASLYQARQAVFQQVEKGQGRVFVNPLLGVKMPKICITGSDNAALQPGVLAPRSQRWGRAS